ncbi:hypothetical protein Nepgr_028504 [Nepenthes gracilis]|uniref:Uncharacterized protein n=1 Tax=Nepenthes gracilis TaxID=150966 RepID=A0AAD3TD65_NEPGR|nr:hypothetical protein Nepgr_028504 [Nepenthes gracilis]
MGITAVYPSHYTTGKYHCYSEAAPSVDDRQRRHHVGVHLTAVRGSVPNPSVRVQGNWAISLSSRPGRGKGT